MHEPSQHYQRASPRSANASPPVSLYRIAARICRELFVTSVSFPRSNGVFLALTEALSSCALHDQGKCQKRPATGLPRRKVLGGNRRWIRYLENFGCW
jgi:hypothetical protein